MKFQLRKSILLCGLCALCVSAFNSYAENPMASPDPWILEQAAGTGTGGAVSTTAASPSTQNIIQTTFGWFSSQNTNLTFARVSVWEAGVYQAGSLEANEVGTSYDFWRESTNNASCLFSALEARARQAPGVGTPFLSQGVGPEFGLIKYDIKVGIYIDGVWVTQPIGAEKTKGFTVEGGGFISKKLTDNTGLGVFLGLQWGQNLPLLGIDLNAQF